MVVLAKPDESLLDHTENALKVFKSIREAYPQVPDICGIPDFWDHLFYSIFFHDFGKAASGFQRLLLEKKKWEYRHEILSAGFVSGLDYENKLFRDAISMAIMTHHKDVKQLRDEYPTYPGKLGKSRYDAKLQELSSNFSQLIEIQNRIPELSLKYLGKRLQNFNIISSIEDLSDEYRKVVLPYYIDSKEKNLNELHGTYGVFLKGFLTACDHLSSGGKYAILNGIQDMVSLYDFPELRKTQQLALKTKGDTFLIAPTGSGKTEAAMFWSQANQNHNRSRRVFYVLPYTASINAMYRRLEKDFSNSELIGIQHGKAMYYLYKAFAEDEDYATSKDKARITKDLTNKIYRPYKVLTPYQILKSFFGVKGFEQHFAEMSNGLFIIDEIHAYDAHTTSLIIETFKVLKNEYGVNFLIMSATLPTFIKEIFRQELDITNEISLTENELKAFTRHKVTVLEKDIFFNLDLIRRELSNDKKVLVVCNTVQQAQKIYELLSGYTVKSKLIHGKFILRDREEIEKELKNQNLLVGTQTIEVSLNIDYDVLFSEPAPIDALIQRFGRVYRKGWENGIIKPVYVFEEGSENDKFVYKNQEIVAKTVSLLKMEDILEESVIQRLVDNVYESGYQGKDLEEFNQVKQRFPMFFKEIVPFMNSKNSEHDFSSLFDSIEVVPLTFKSDYLEEIANKRYFEAMKYIVSISVHQYVNLKNDDSTEEDSGTLFIYTDYDSEMGLLLYKDPDNGLQ